MAHAVPTRRDADSDLHNAQAVARCLGDRTLNTMQEAGLPHVLGSLRNLVVAAPTGSGKTLLAEIALVRGCLAGHAGVYLCPLRALATERHEDWTRLAMSGLQLYKTTGDDEGFDASRAAAADLLLATPERWDALCRHGLPTALRERIGTIVVDEVHLLGEGGRGPVLEALLVRLRRLFPNTRLVAMSGTLTNAAALATWLDADLFVSDWRPLPLTWSIETYADSGQRVADEAARSAIALRVAQDTVREEGGATLIFCGSRKGVEECALTIARGLGRMSSRLPRALSSSSMTGSVENATLRLTLASGVGFHHAGLAIADRAVVESLYRSRAVAVLVATTTVAAGVNLPARTVVVRDLQVGQNTLGASLLLQMAGRAGRVGFETRGHCVVITPKAQAAAVEKMIAGEPVTSCLGSDLLTPLCTEIVLGLVRDEAEVVQWYGGTFHAHVATDKANPRQALSSLLGAGIVRHAAGRLEATTLGQTTSDAMISRPFGYSAGACPHGVAGPYLERCRRIGGGSIACCLCYARRV